MKIATVFVRLVPFVLLGLALAGCETLEERVRTTREVPSMTHMFDAPAQAVMDVAPSVLAQMGFSVTDISPARGQIEAITDIRRDTGMRSYRQTRLRFSIQERDGGFSWASLQAWEIREEENARGESLMSQVGVTNPSFHQTIFNTIEEVLGKPPGSSG